MYIILRGTNCRGIEGLPNTKFIKKNGRKDRILQGVRKLFFGKLGANIYFKNSEKIHEDVLRYYILVYLLKYKLNAGAYY